MSATAWFVIAIVGFSLCGIALIAAVFMFIKMNIPSIIGDLTGKTVAREIKAMRDENASSGDKRFKPSKVNMERGKLTEKVTIDTGQTGKGKTVSTTKNAPKSKAPPKKQITESFSTDVRPKKTDVLNKTGSLETAVLESEATEVLSDNVADSKYDATEIIQGDSTTVLDAGDATTVLGASEETAVLNESTTVLSEGTTVLSEGTTVLSQESQTEKLKVDFKVTRKIVDIHSDEVV